MDVNFCVGCDNTAVDGFYCSETCRLADLERSAPGSPMYSTGGSSYVDYHGHHDHSHTHHHHHHGSTSSGSLQDLATGAESHPGRSTVRTMHDRSSQPSPHRDLSPASPPRYSSLSSSHPTHVPEEMQRELRSYYNAFDRVRELRRRSTPGTTLPSLIERPRQHSH